MNIQELLKCNYEDVVKHLLVKYGEVPGDYFSPTWIKNTKMGRGNEGLYIHHIDEDKAIMLSTKSYAMKNPWDYQKAERLVYCNLLEHLILHVKITELPNWPYIENSNGLPGIGGVLNFFIPELNDIFSGIEYKIPWKINMVKIIKPLKEDYLNIIKHIALLPWIEELPWIEDELLLTSFNEKYGIWTDDKNQEIYNEIIEIIPAQGELLNKKKKLELERKQTMIIYQNLQDKTIISKYPLLKSRKNKFIFDGDNLDFWGKKANLNTLETLMHKKGNKSLLEQYNLFLKEIGLI